MICAGLSREKANELYLEVLQDRDEKAMVELCQEDLFFLLTVGCKRKDIDRDWLYDRCREVEASPDGHLDLWARDHYKSTIITFGKTIQDILEDPEITVGIFSHTRPIAKGFLEQIKREFETNTFLQNLFPEVLYKEPHKQAPKWALDSGIIVKRKTNPKEATVEAWGLVDGQPTGRHFMLKVYDDVVTMESVTTPDQIKKTTSAWEMSQNLGSGDRTKRRYIGTRYALHDTYHDMMKRESVVPRIHTATTSGEYPGEPVLLSVEVLAQKRKDMGPYTFGTQMLQDPVADKAMGFREGWLKFYERSDSVSAYASWNKYILVDPASKKKSTSDYTVMNVWGLAPDGNYYLLDAIRDRLNLTQRSAKVFELRRKWSPMNIGYEEYGLQADIEHIEYVQGKENYRFNITPLGGSMPKNDRIQRLVPKFEQGLIYLPKILRFINYEGRSVDYIEAFKTEEYLAFPVSKHDDMLDCAARMLDAAMDVKFPTPAPPQDEEEYGYRGAGSWMS